MVRRAEMDWHMRHTFPPPVLTGSGSTGSQCASQPFGKGTPRWAYPYTRALVQARRLEAGKCIQNNLIKFRRKRMDLEIRQVGPEAAAVVGGMIAGLLQEFAPGDMVDIPAMTATAEAVLAMNTVTGLVAMRSGETVGLLMLYDCAAIYAGGRFGEITELYVRPDTRSHGVDARLLAEAERLGRARGWHRIEVGAPEQPEWARTLAFCRRE
jgi:GNAT superfamily N-acetyltransferase